MAFRGQRFHVDLSDDEDTNNDNNNNDNNNGNPLAFVGDIQERSPAAPVPPSAPTLSSSSLTGFPASRFRRQQQRQKTSPAPSNPIADVKKSIDQENAQRLAAMSVDEINEERADIMANLPSSLIERFLRRATIDDNHTQFDNTPSPKKSGPFDTITKEPEQKDEVTEEKEVEDKAGEDQLDDETEDMISTLNDLYPASETPDFSMHFPKQPVRSSPMPNLDPTSPYFLSDLQTHYFPNTPHDPASLSWLSPSTEAPSSSPYHPDSTASSIAPAALRFSLDGAILAPRTSLSIPLTKGLHHHAADPEAAGYTIPELGILSRSVMPPQRCLAWQILGRLLYRLGTGEFGKKDSPLVNGLWSVVERERVIDGMLAEASGDQLPEELIQLAGDTMTAADATNSGPRPGSIGKHASARAWATEALWLWNRGDGARGLKRSNPAV
ncbi:hypothetical protein FQN57_000852 [Myotisia sp. PD_48]|nr:hypothetical protein FQN57_000852 [Myotisia sp. PD_48]